MKNVRRSNHFNNKFLNEQKSVYKTPKRINRRTNFIIKETEKEKKFKKK